MEETTEATREVTGSMNLYVLFVVILVPRTYFCKVVEWFTQTNANLTAEYGHTIPSLAFYHIPAHAMLGYQEEGVDANTNPGINGETVIAQGTGDTDYSGQDRRFMQALLNTTGLMGTFSGHDHDNDWYEHSAPKLDASFRLTAAGASNGTGNSWTRI